MTTRVTIEPAHHTIKVVRVTQCPDGHVIHTSEELAAWSHSRVEYIHSNMHLEIHELPDGPAPAYQQFLARVRTSI
jgi:hypothetical protein